MKPCPPTINGEPLMEEQGEFELRQRLALALWDLPGKGRNVVNKAKDAEG